jgi:hypothetical protein
VNDKAATGSDPTPREVVAEGLLAETAMAVVVPSIDIASTLVAL